MEKRVLNGRSRFLVPNLFTGLNFLLGIFAILVIASNYHLRGEEGHVIIGKAPIMLGAWIILWSVLLDKLDGFAARVMNASSDFGAQFDSLADLIAFGVAPAFLVYFYLQHINPDWASAHLPLLLVSLSVYVLCAAMRLARYNAIDSTELKAYFHGLPSTFSGGFAALGVILFDSYGLDSNPHRLMLLPLLLIFLGMLMVSPLYLPKLVRRKAKWLNLLQIAGVISGYICGFGMVLPEYLFSMLVVYGIFGFGHGFLNKGLIEGRPEKDHEPAPA